MTDAATGQTRPYTGQGETNPLFTDTEQLRGIASDRIIRRGIAYFKEHRVTDLGWEADRLWALVEGSRPGEPYSVEISVDADGELVTDCDCPFDWEPVCKHSVAVLLSYAARQPASEKLIRSAAERAVEDRVKRGRTQVTGRLLSGQPWFGTYAVRSLSSEGVTARSYTVQIRSLTRRMNYCTCPDFAVNRLGTCKHIEAVVYQVRKKFRRKKFLQAADPILPFVYLAWDVPDGPRIRLHRGTNMPTDLTRLLQAHFDADGFLEGGLPEAFHRFQNTVFGRTDIQVGEDAVKHVRRMSEEAAHRVVSARIHSEIARSGGHLPGIRARLYPYQVEGVAFLASSGRALLADDMGLGKTLQAIAAARYLMLNSGLRRTLVVCPASLKHQWAREIERFAGDEVQVVSGPAAGRQVQYRRHAPFTVMNYELVRRDLSLVNELLAPDLLVLDEAQRIKNWRTKTATVIKMINSRHAFVLTGTPLENRLEDLYSVMQVIDDRVLGPLWRFLLDFHVTNERGRVIGYRGLSDLRRRLEPVMLRRDRRLVRDQLPERLDLRMDVPLTRKQKELHDSAVSAAAQLASIMKKRPLTPSEEHRMMAALQQARMACNAAGLVDKETKGSPKLDELRQLLQDLCLEAGRKVVVFSQWERMTAMAERVARDLGMGTARLHGGVPTSKRGDLLDRFRNDDGTQVLISTDAGGVGLNLQAASAVINLEMPWNPAVLEQRIGRVHRLGQRDPVQVVLMVAADSYEERVADLVTSKRELFDNVVDAEAAEDVVGVSKRTLDLLTEGLETEPTAPSEPAAPSEPTADAAAEPTADYTPGPGPADAGSPDTASPDASSPDAGSPGASSFDVSQEPAPLPDPRADERVRSAVTELQERLGDRLERVLAARGGLVAVVDVVDEVVEAVAESVSDGVQVAAVDSRSLASLHRLGTASPLAGAAEIPSRVSDNRADRAPHGPNPLVETTRRKLKAAEVLLSEKCAAEGLGLAVEAMISALSLRAGRTELPSRTEVPVWLFGEAVPRGIASAEDAAAVSRAIALADAPSVPDELIHHVLVDVRRITASESEAADAGGD